MKFTIDYSKWRCGLDGEHQVGEGLINLLNKEGYMCCLGQCELQRGIPEHNLLEVGYPCNILFNDKSNDPFLNGNGNNDLAVKAARINDAVATTSKKKISLLKSLFKEHGHEIEFINVPA